MLANQGLAHSEGCMGQAGGDCVNDSSATVYTIHHVIYT